MKLFCDIPTPVLKVVRAKRQYTVNQTPNGMDITVLGEITTQVEVCVPVSVDQAVKGAKQTWSSIKKFTRRTWRKVQDRYGETIFNALRPLIGFSFECEASFVAA